MTTGSQLPRVPQAGPLADGGARVEFPPSGPAGDDAVTDGQGRTPAGTVRVGVVDDELVVAGLAQMLGSQLPGFEVACLGADGDGGARIETGATDVVLVDTAHQRPDLRRAAETLLVARVGRLVVYTSSQEEGQVLGALRAGAAGYLLKSTEPTVLGDQLRRVAAGETVVDPQVGARLAVHLARDTVPAWPAQQWGLSRRESEVLGLVVEGQRNQAIAKQLFVGTETVKSHLQAIYRKLGVNNRTQAVTVALRHGLYR
ncbi:MAG TPA: response regulator transcription factor [Acidimicrobiales bacterium]|jgi:DNA-binding NarL/FixJ family response regulator|nr:response regulator transcription factor [Acidimicrobiales bacterium]